MKSCKNAASLNKELINISNSRFLRKVGFDDDFFPCAFLHLQHVTTVLLPTFANIYTGIEVTVFIYSGQQWAFGV